MVMTFKVSRATFNGRHNHNKALVFLAMYLDETEGAGKGLQYKDIMVLTGVNRDNARLSILYRYGYLLRHVNEKQKGFPVYWKLSMRGRRFVTDRIPPHKYIEFIEVIRSNQKKLKEQGNV